MKSNAILAVSLVVLLTGCFTISPATSGKTKTYREFSNVVGADGQPGETVYWKEKNSFPAGYKGSVGAEMAYETFADESAKMSVGSVGEHDTTAQAELIAQVVAINAQMVSGLAEGITAGVIKALEITVPEAAPLIKQRLDNQAAEDAARHEERTGMQDLVDRAVERVLQPQPRTAP